MSVTYSINTDSSIESTRKVDINSVLQSIPNNTQKLIRPRDVRDGFLSTWSNSVFKLTSPQNSSLEYIGLDSGNPQNRDIKNKILIGKRNFGNIDVMNNQLLNSNTDIFFYNTKSDEQDQSSTKIGILAGTQSNLDAPYFESFATTSQFNFNIVNPSGGDVSIKSTTGNVFLNDIPFPKVSESPNDGDVLKYSGIYPLGKLEWGQADIAVTSTIGTPGQETNIFGSEVNLNGFSLEFVNDSLVPNTIGGIEQGSSFSTGSFQGQNWPLSEVIRELLYPYVSPKLEISVFNQDTGFDYGDIGFNSLLTITYSVTTFARESSEDLFDIKILKSPSDIIQNIGTFSANPGSSTFSTITDVDLSPTGQPVEFLISCDNFIGLNTATSSFRFIRPFVMFLIDQGDSVNNIDDNDVFNGTGNAQAILDIFLSQQVTTNEFSKTLLPYEDINTIIPMDILPSGSSNYLYFAYPFEYPELTGVRTVSNGFISGPQSFIYSNNPTISGGVYGEYRIYKSTNPVIISPGLEKFQLLFSAIVFNTIQPNLINDNWEFLPILLPSIQTGSVKTNNSIFSNTTNSIIISYNSINGNDYTTIFSQILLGSIIRVTFDTRFINYVCLSPVIPEPGGFRINVQYIQGLHSFIGLSIGDQIQFELITL
jgi:hypothetical protein